MDGIKTPEQVEFADLLKRTGLKPAQLAPKLGISASAISLILNGKRNPRRTTLMAMRQIASGQGEALPPREPNAPDQAKSLAAREAECLRDLEKLPVGEREEVLSIFREMVSYAVKRVTGAKKKPHSPKASPR